MVREHNIRIGITGAAGRMGTMLIRAVVQHSKCQLVAANELGGHSALGLDAGEVAGVKHLSVPLSDDVNNIFENSDVVIDFTLPSATIDHAESAAKNGTALIIGTTGLNLNQQEALHAASKKAPIVQAPNMSLCVNLLMKFAEKAANILDEGYDVEIVEMHHNKKVDSPSGTALGLGQSVAMGRGVLLEEVSERGRDGVIGPRKRGNIGFAALRGGDIVGDHTVIFAAEGERIELTHRASNRLIYARGALRAAVWAHQRNPGYYTMADVLELNRLSGGP